MSKARNKILSLGLAVMLTLGALATGAPPLTMTAHAAGTYGPDGLETGTNNYQDGAGGSIYLGRYQQTKFGPVGDGSSPPVGTKDVDYIIARGFNSNILDYEDTYYLIDPIQWRVLSVTDSDIYLLSGYILDAQQFHPNNNSWSGSTLRIWINDNTATGFNAYSGIEEIAISGNEITLFDEPELSNYFSGTIGAAANANLVSYATDYAYYSRRNGRDADQAGAWWLRSPGSHSSFRACRSP